MAAAFRGGRRGVGSHRSGRGRRSPPPPSSGSCGRRGDVRPSSSTPWRASRPAPRTRSCCRACRISCSTGPSWPPVPWAPARIVVCVADDHDDTAAAVLRAVAERTGTVARTGAGRSAAPAGPVRRRARSRPWSRGSTVARERPRGGRTSADPLSIGRSAALVHNAETLAHMALVARYGPASFRAAGIAGRAGDDSGDGVAVASSTPASTRSPWGRRCGVIVNRARPTDEVVAVLTGGFGGTWVPAARARHRLRAAPLAAVGRGRRCRCARGPDPRHACGIAETARVARYMAGESAGQCGPCVFGLPAVADDLERPGRRHAPTPPWWRDSRCGSPRSTVAGRAVTPTGSPAWCAAPCRCSPPTPPRTPRGGPARSPARPSVLPPTDREGTAQRRAEHERRRQGEPDRLRGLRLLRRAPARARHPRRMGIPGRRRAAPCLRTCVELARRAAKECPRRAFLVREVSRAGATSGAGARSRAGSNTSPAPWRRARPVPRSAARRRPRRAASPI